MTPVRHAVKAVADFLEDCNYAQRRVTELRIFGRDPDRAPATYTEFLFRSPVAVWHEPPARRRRAGGPPRR